MRKALLSSLAIFALLATSCKNRGLDYLGPDQIKMAWQDEYTVLVKSDYKTSVTSSNERIISATGNDNEIFGKNIGDANVTVSNGYNEVTLPVNVSLFVEPTFEFGCNQAKIVELYGNPTKNFADTVYAYGGKEPGVSPACWRMDFYFNDSNQYFLSSLYIRSKLNGNSIDGLVTNYLDKNFVMDSTFVADSTTYYMYHNIVNQSIKCEKRYDANDYHDIGLVYYTTN